MIKIFQITAKLLRL